MYQSEPLSLFVWHQLRGRVEVTVAKESQALRASLLPKSANVDTAVVLLERAEQIREGLPAKLLRLEQLLMFSLQMENQLTIEEFQIDLPMMQAQLSRLHLLTHDLLHAMVQQPPRLSREQDLRAALVQMDILINSGNGERLQEERVRVRSIERDIYPIGEEDTEYAQKRLHRTSMSLDALQSEILTLKNGHEVRMRFPFEMQSLLNEFEVNCVWAPEEDSQQAEIKEALDLEISDAAV